MIITLTSAVLFGLFIFFLLAPLEGIGTVAVIVLLLLAIGAIEIKVGPEVDMTANAAVTVTQTK